MNYEMSQRDSDWHGPMSDPNAGGTLQQIQKEQREAFNKRYCQREPYESKWILSPGEAEDIKSFLSKSIRIAYGAGQDTLKGGGASKKYREYYGDGYRAGLERAKELVPTDTDEHITTMYGKASFQAYTNTELNRNNHAILSALDDEIAKHPL